ncbi:hypothetical protein K503DRAFT_857185 [Rhizopogon vinicolor AM-OR11-026]|uniref:DUF6534 domain-containing protein n=1 Tax=Rhizopogon vinicolor AM-OR11-026 TaxID=1314800 RepID=A0A1B7MYN5_9AGAM|nr:hypothetical protein K503DRAFT_857185 [Rhizopogon vinicolor AM-OR11-026]
MSTMSSSSTLDIGNTFGALFIGAVLSAVLFGLSNVQAFIYFQTHRGTGITFYKLVVACLFTHYVYYYLVTNYANVSVLTEIVWSFKLQAVVNAIIITGVLFLYVYRIWIVSKGRSRAFPVAAFLVFLNLCIWIVMIWETYHDPVPGDSIKYNWVLYMSLGLSTSIDIIIASSLCYLFATSRTGFSSMDTFITKLMCYIVNTGILTSICSLAVIITCAAMPSSFFYIGIDFLLAKLYINSYIALLNARYYLQPNSDVMDSPKPHIPHNANNPELPIRATQADDIQASRKILFELEVVHPTRPVQAVTAHISIPPPINTTTARKDTN